MTPEVPLEKGRDWLFGASAPAIHFAWLIRLRFGATLGQLAVTAFVHRVMEIRLPLVAIGGLLLGALLVNVGSLFWARRYAVRDVHVAFAMALDLLIFTGLLYVTGGPSNPFGSLYLIHIALAAVVLPPFWSWALVLLALVCSAGLFFEHRPLLEAHAHHGAHHASFDAHMRGMWVALGVAASFIVYFLHRVTRALRERDRELAFERERTLRHERAATLTRLAAGAAHELASPLGTIAVASGELQNELRRQGASSAVLSDVELIRAEVARCRRILDQMATDSGQPAGESLVPLGASALAELALADLPGRERVDVRASAASEREQLWPGRALVQAVRSLLENALHASEQHGRVALFLDSTAELFRIQVTDTGVGMTQDVLERATDPFFTTRSAGRGMGLGLFLAQSVADQLGGRLELDSAPGSGTRATLVFPLTIAEKVPA